MITLIMNIMLLDMLNNFVLQPSIKRIIYLKNIF